MFTWLKSSDSQDEYVEQLIYIKCAALEGIHTAYTLQRPSFKGITNLH